MARKSRIDRLATRVPSPRKSTDRAALAWPKATPRALRLGMSTALSATPHAAPAKPSLAMAAPTVSFGHPVWDAPRAAANPYLAYASPKPTAHTKPATYATPASYAPSPATSMAPPRASDNSNPSTLGAFWALPTPVFGAVGEQSILPQIKTVYPTGEKPLVVVALKCPTELVGIDTPASAMMHTVVQAGMNLVNSTNLLSFNLQQVCE